MSHVLLLISNPQSRAVTPGLVAAAAGAAAVGPKAFTFLSEGVAAEADLAGNEPARAANAVCDAIAGAPVDVAVVEKKTRRKALFLADMDSTMIEQECVDELADFKDLKPEISAITERAMRGEIAFEDALRERVGLLKGVTREEIDSVIAEKITMTAGALRAVRTMRRHGTYCVLVSGGFTLFTKAVAARLGFDENHANTLIMNNGALTGEVASPILGQDAKRETLRRTSRARGLDLAQTMAVGDGANDLAMIEQAGLGVAFRAKPVLRQKADVSIMHSDLTALLYLQGYRDADFTDE